jgi:hypothetical protein
VLRRGRLCDSLLGGEAVFVIFYLEYSA